MLTSSKVNLCDLPYPALERFVVEELGAKKFRAMQLWQWIWAKNATGFDVMTDISQSDREKLADLAEIRWPSIADVRVSSDGTTKFLLELADKFGRRRYVFRGAAGLRAHRGSRPGGKNLSAREAARRPSRPRPLTAAPFQRPS